MKDFSADELLTKPLVIALLGPTASGKTTLAIELAKKLSLSVINVDSRQIYIGMDIGTAKPSAEQQLSITHHLIDLRQPDDPINLKEFQELAQLQIDEELKARRIPFLVGGSGLYLRSLTAGLHPPPVKPQQLIRKQLLKIGQGTCYQLLQKADPTAARRIAPADALRTQRALEVIYATGQPISSLQNSIPPPWRVLEIGLDPKDLHDRIANRTAMIYANGLIEETQQLIQRFSPHLPLLKTIGYSEALQVLDGQISPEQAIALTTRKTNQFAKRQRTWFRRKHKPYWLNDEEPLSEALCLIKRGLG